MACGLAIFQHCHRLQQLLIMRILILSIVANRLSIFPACSRDHGRSTRKAEANEAKEAARAKNLEIGAKFGSSSEKFKFGHAVMVDRLPMTPVKASDGTLRPGAAFGDPATFTLVRLLATGGHGHIWEASELQGEGPGEI